MQKKQILSALLAAALLFSALPVKAAAAPEELTGQWYEAAMTKWVDRGVLSGYTDGTLRPSRDITRGELAVILDRIMDYQTKAKNTYSDLEKGKFYTDAVLGATAAGVIAGDPSGTVRPNASITRQEAAAMFARVTGISELGAPSANFADQASISPFAVKSVNAMKATGYMGAKETKFRPLDPITRAEVATVLNNIFEGYFNQAQTYSVDVKGSAVVNASGVTLKDMKIGKDLIIAEGVGKGDVYLDGVTIGGKLIVRGGGENSIHILGNSEIGSVVIVRQDGKVRVSVEGAADVQIVVIEDGSDDVKIEGEIGALRIEAAGVTVEVTGTVSQADFAESAVGSVLRVAEGANVGPVGVSAQGAKITGDGKVESVEAKADDVSVDTPKTKVSAAPGTSGVTAGDKPVAGGSTETVPTPSGGTTPPSGGVVTPDPALNISVTKLATAPADDNESDSQANQDAVSVSKTGNTVTVTGVLGALNAFDSTVPEQGSHKWIGLVVNTGESSILGVSYNGAALTQADVDEAASVGVGAGKFVLWVKADELATADKTFTLAKSGKTSVTTTIKFYNTDVTLTESNITGEATSPTKAQLAAYLNALFTFSGSGTVAWNDSTDTLTVSGYTVAHNKDSETDTTASAWTVWTGRVMDGFNLDLSGVTAFSLASGSWLHVQSNATLTLPSDAKITLNGGVITKDGTAADTAWGFKANGDPKYFQVLKGTLPSYSYEEKVTGYPDPSATVTTAGELTAALANTDIKTINVSGTIGSTSAYTLYTVGRPVTIQGTEGNAVYGTFAVTADGVTLQNITVNNKGDTVGNTSGRAAVYAYADGITITGCTFNAPTVTEPGEGLSNGVVILPKTGTAAYIITGNTFNGYDTELSGYSSSGLLISGGISKDFLSMGDAKSVTANLSEEQDLAIINGNTFNDCTNDYQREYWTADYDLMVLCKSISNGDNLLFDYAASSARYYIAGNITRESDATILAGSTVTVLAGKTLTMAEGTTLTVNGTLDGTLNGTDETSKLIIGTEDGAGTYYWNNEWVPDLLTAINFAKSYEYTPTYTYTGSSTVTSTDDGITVAYTAAAGAFIKQPGDANTRATMDLARLLGALHRFNNGVSVSKITFDGDEYTWNDASDLLGSNWMDGSTTLVSAIVDALTPPNNAFDLIINGETVTFTVTIAT